METTATEATLTLAIIAVLSSSLEDEELRGVVERPDDAREDWIVLEDCVFTSVASFDAASTADTNAEDVDPPSFNASNDCKRAAEVMELAAATLPGTEIEKLHSTL